MKSNKEKRIKFWAKWTLWIGWLFFIISAFTKISQFDYLAYLSLVVCIVLNLSKRRNDRQAEKLEFEQFLVDIKREDEEYMERYNKRLEELDNLGGDAYEKFKRRQEFYARYSRYL